MHGRRGDDPVRIRQGRGEDPPGGRAVQPETGHALAGGPRRVALTLLPLAALGLVAGLDALSEHFDSGSLLVLGLLDEPAHLATAWLFLAAFLPVQARTTWLWALIGAVAIDVDHVPLYLWHVGAADPNSRPVTHSLATVVLLVVIAAVASHRLRAPLLGVALGTVLHFVRDLAEGPGVPLLWPFDATNVTLPHGTYLLVLAVVAGAAAARPWLPVPITIGRSRAARRPGRSATP